MMKIRPAKMITLIMFLLILGLTQVAQSQDLQTILDAVSIDRLIETVRHLSGEESFETETGPDSIITRYTYSTGIHKAQDYIVNVLEETGFDVQLQPFSMDTFYDIKFAPDQPENGWITAENSIIRTTDGGETWLPQDLGPGASSIWSLFPIDHQTAFAVGEYGAIHSTHNGGFSWESRNWPGSEFLMGVWFADTQNGWICGDNGLILKTSSNGAFWSEKPTPTNNRLYDLFFVSQTEGWAVGRDGVIIHTTDAGETWNLQTSATDARLYGVHFIDALTGFAVGWEGTVVKTENGGNQWSEMTVPVNEQFYDIDFIDMDHGLIVGKDGVCLKSQDGGDTWTQGGDLFNAHIYGCDIVAPDNAWATGDITIAQTNDLGETWMQRENDIPAHVVNNIIAEKPGSVDPDAITILCGHYDSISENSMVRAPGADDNGSGTAAVLEAARVLAEQTFDYTIKLILFSGEEQGLIGSTLYAESANVNGEQILGVVNLDMIAYHPNNDGRFELHAGDLSGSQTMANAIVQNIIDWGLNLNAVVFTQYASTRSDHASFWNQGYPAVLFIEDWTSHTPYYHRTGDLSTTFNQDYYLNLSRLAIGSAAQLAGLHGADITNPPIVGGPSAFILSEPYPNPFNPKLNIRFEMLSAAKTRIEVFDILGRKIKILIEDNFNQGPQCISWNGTNQNGEFVATGVYHVSIQAGNQSSSKKVIYLR